VFHNLIQWWDSVQLLTKLCKDLSQYFSALVETTLINLSLRSLSLKAWWPYSEHFIHSRKPKLYNSWLHLTLSTLYALYIGSEAEVQDRELRRSIFGRFPKLYKALAEGEMKQQCWQVTEGAYSFHIVNAELKRFLVRHKLVPLILSARSGKQ
jgi:hypothetical protein